MNPSELIIWAAGFFDGEGSIFLCNATRGRNYVKMQLAQDHNPDLVYQFYEAVNSFGRVYESTIKRKNGTVAQRWTWVAYRSEVPVVLRQLWPYLGRYKKAQSLTALRRFRDENLQLQS